MTEQKEPKEMALGELVLDLIRTERQILILEHDLDPLVLDEYWRNNPYPEGRERSVQRTRKEYEEYRNRFANLLGELNIREQSYSAER